MAGEVWRTLCAEVRLDLGLGRGLLGSRVTANSERRCNLVENHCIKSDEIEWVGGGERGKASGSARDELIRVRRPIQERQPLLLHAQLAQPLRPHRMSFLPGLAVLVKKQYAEAVKDKENGVVFTESQVVELDDEELDIPVSRGPDSRSCASASHTGDRMLTLSRCSSR